MRCHASATDAFLEELSKPETVVPSKGLEPPHPCEYMDLNHARLPIPPRWQVDLHCSSGRKAAESGRPTPSFYRHDVPCQTSPASGSGYVELRLLRDVPT